MLTQFARTAVLVAAVFFAFHPPASGANSEDEAVERLKHFLSAIRTLKADFKQTVLDSQLDVTRESSGTVWLKRPGRFRWNYDTPYEQIIVSDGSRLWMYDPELEQVTVKDAGKSLASSPSMLLTGEGSLNETFRVETLDREGELSWIKLVPRIKDSQFELVRLGVSDEYVETMELTDNLGQITRIHFSNVSINPALPGERFEFEPPEGADVVGDSPGG